MATSLVGPGQGEPISLTTSSLSWCAWQYGVSEANASAVGNLQVIPWFVNVSRGGGLALEQLVGWPYPVKRRRAGHIRDRGGVAGSD